VNVHEYFTPVTIQFNSFQQQARSHVNVHEYFTPVTIQFNSFQQQTRSPWTDYIIIKTIQRKKETKIHVATYASSQTEMTANIRRYGA